MHYKKLKRALKFFGLFLVLGFLHDLKGFLIEDENINSYLYVLYVLAEVSFYAWFLFTLGDNLIELKPIRKIFFLAIIPFWALSHFILEDSMDHDIYSGLYDGITAVFISSISAYIIFQYTRIEKSLWSLPDFWIIGGIFFYFFCNTFIFGVMSKEIADEAWQIHRIINLMTMFCYAYGFHLAGAKSSVSI